MEGGRESMRVKGWEGGRRRQQQQYRCSGSSRARASSCVSRESAEGKEAKDEGKGIPCISLSLSLASSLTLFRRLPVRLAPCMTCAHPHTHRDQRSRTGGERKDAQSRLTAALAAQAQLFS